MNLRYWASAVVVIVFAIQPGARAETRDEVLRAMDHCASIADDHARLACFDALAPEVKTALAEAPETASRPPTIEEQKSWFGFDIGSLFGSSPKQQATPEQFGSENLPPPPTKADEAPPPGPIEEITAKVTDYAMNPFGKFVVFLDNGQVWRQLQGDSEKAQFDKHGDNIVIISRGLIGSYNLQINDSNKVFKVKRIK